MNCPHCKIHVNEHTASRCFDAWVAEDVMEWKPYFIISYNILYPPGRQRVCDEHTYIYKDFRSDKPYEFGSEHFYDSREKPPYTQPIVPSFSTSISAAWLVVEKLSDKGIGIDRFLDENNVLFWDVGFFMKPAAQADTAPLAICRAAIKACVT